MLPTLRSSGDVILVEKITTRLGNIKRGDVVVVTSPNNPDRLICKRIVGLVHYSYGLPFNSRKMMSSQI